MARKKAWKPPYLRMLFQMDGKTLMELEAPTAGVVSTPLFEARMAVNTDARPLAIAVTLTELAAHLSRYVPHVSEQLKACAASLIAVDMLTGNRSEGDWRGMADPEAPF